MLIASSFFVLAMTGCGEDQRKSLLGDWQAPPSEALANETITIWLEADATDVDRNIRTYVIAQGGTVSFEQTRDDGAPFHPPTYQVVEKRATYKLSAQEYRSALDALALIRPNEQGIGTPPIQPKGCTQIYDTPSWAGVSFESSPGQSSWFQLQHLCANADGRPVKVLITDVIQRLDQAQERYR